jgi:CRISPR-associated endonuclease Cas1 subtype I-B
VVQKVNREYHILQDGILNKKDYALLFENEREKHHIPVEIVDQLNLYGDVMITSNVLRTLGEKKIKLAIFNSYGELMGTYLPEKNTCVASLALRQCKIYVNEEERLEVAKQMEIAGLHNMRANMRYYNKKSCVNLAESIGALSKLIVDINECRNGGRLLLIEARARQMYYEAFNFILQSEDFQFVRRTKRPPRDELNALISFGNTLMYNKFLQIIWKTSLDPRIGIVHATTRRSHSLNLDFADIFKPIISDRVIFSLINGGKLQTDMHFHKDEYGGVLMNQDGKRIFLEEFDRKLNTKIVVKGESVTYYQLMRKEVVNFQKMLEMGKKYKPYKYY